MASLVRACCCDCIEVEFTARFADSSLDGSNLIATLRHERTTCDTRTNQDRTTFFRYVSKTENNGDLLVDFISASTPLYQVLYLDYWIVEKPDGTQTIYPYTTLRYAIDSNRLKVIAVVRIEPWAGAKDPNICDAPEFIAVTLPSSLDFSVFDCGMLAGCNSYATPITCELYNRLAGQGNPVYVRYKSGGGGSLGARSSIGGYPIGGIKCSGVKQFPSGCTVPCTSQTASLWVPVESVLLYNWMQTLNPYDYRVCLQLVIRLGWATVWTFTNPCDLVTDTCDVTGQLYGYMLAAVQVTMVSSSGEVNKLWLVNCKRVTPFYSASQLESMYSGYFTNPPETPVIYCGMPYQLLRPPGWCFQVAGQDPEMPVPIAGGFNMSDWYFGERLFGILFREEGTPACPTSILPLSIAGIYGDPGQYNTAASDQADCNHTSGCSPRRPGPYYPNTDNRSAPGGIAEWDQDDPPTPTPEEYCLCGTAEGASSVYFRSAALYVAGNPTIDLEACAMTCDIGESPNANVFPRIVRLYLPETLSLSWYFNGYIDYLSGALAHSSGDESRIDMYTTCDIVGKAIEYGSINGKKMFPFNFGNFPTAPRISAAFTTYLPKYGAGSEGCIHPPQLQLYSGVIDSSYPTAFWPPGQMRVAFPFSAAILTVAFRGWNSLLQQLVMHSVERFVAIHIGQPYTHTDIGADFGGYSEPKVWNSNNVLGYVNDFNFSGFYLQWPGLYGWSEADDKYTIDPNSWYVGLLRFLCGGAMYPNFCPQAGSCSAYLDTLQDPNIALGDICMTEIANNKSFPIRLIPDYVTEESQMSVVTCHSTTQLYDGFSIYCDAIIPPEVPCLAKSWPLPP